MEFKLVLGVDISKEWFNYCLMTPQFDILWEGQAANALDAIFAFQSELLGLGHTEKLADVLLCMEHTGIYVQHLSRCWLAKGGPLSMVHATKVGEHLAGQFPWEEKDDATDARRLAEYAFRFTDKLKLWKAKGQALAKLQGFQRQRGRLIGAINLLAVPVKESEEFDSCELSRALAENQAASLKALKGDLEQLEKRIGEIIESDAHLSQLFKWIASVEGVGPVTAREMIIATGGFTDFLPSEGKSFARYSGVVPNRFKSGKSVKKKEKTGKRAHKKLKSLLTMGAHSLINTKSELGIYYRRKMAEGKHHLSVINAMRNKIILRVFAVVRNQVMYQKNLNLCLENP